MSQRKTIDFGIDLGTTNSAIAKFNKGEVEVFSNPKDYGRSTLPSVVGFRKTSIFVGTKAKEYAVKDPGNVKSLFKRKMGTTETLQVPAIKKSLTPIELSSLVVKELKNFVHTGEIVDSVIITIPSAFNTQQSQATMQAGLEAGIKEVVLLQEPIAASLAYANSTGGDDLPNGYWIVYDLGGGTFDVALLRSEDGDVRVVDHEGDNYLGGADFDDLIVQKLFVPAIESEGTFDDLKGSLVQASGSRNGDYETLLVKAEQVKINLSTATSTEIDIFGITDDEDEDLDFELTVTRSEFESLIQETVDLTSKLLKQLLVQNNLQPSDVNFALMVGGSTFIPYVRQRISEVLQVEVKHSVDPTTAIAIGAAYYAGSKQASENADSNSSTKEKAALSWKLVYEKATRDESSPILIKVLDGYEKGFSCRIFREDGGFDSGWVELKQKMDFDLPIGARTYNVFKIEVQDSTGDQVAVNEGEVHINSGVTVAGQPLPDDISLEVDDLDTGLTKLQPLFRKNTILPVSTSIRRPVTKSIAAGELDGFRFRIVEGPSENPVAANNTVGYWELAGKELAKDVLKGSDIDLEIEIDESRIITIRAYLAMSDQSFEKSFSLTMVDLKPSVLIEDAEAFNTTLAKELENHTDSIEFRAIEKRASELQWEIGQLTDDDVRDEKQKLANELGSLVSDFHAATKEGTVIKAKREYHERKQACQEIVQEHGTEQEHKFLREILAEEEGVLNSQSLSLITQATESLTNLYYEIVWRTPGFLRSYCEFLKNSRDEFVDQIQGQALLKATEDAVDDEYWDRTAALIGKLIDLLPSDKQADAERIVGF